jgi:aldehyde:ferredoxin oxidoreductase
MCLFANLEPESVLELINSATGLDWSVKDMMNSGERAWNLKRGINNRLGLRRENDRLPKALLQAYNDIQPEVAFVPDLESMLEAYYAHREWDLETGFPRKLKLQELNLNFLANDLYTE